jgi:hypothetical protein
VERDMKDKNDLKERVEKALKEKDEANKMEQMTQ